MLRSTAPSSLALALLLAGPAAAQSGEPISARFDISIGGLQVGVAGFEGRVSNDTYEAAISLRLSGISRLIASGRGSARAEGRFAGGRAVPASYTLQLTTTQQSDNIRMTMGGGSVRVLTAEPERPPAPDAVPLVMSHRQNVLDPIAAAFFVGPTGAQACDKVFPVFDGRQRYDLAFSFSSTEELKVPGYTGPAVVCNARYRPVAGHRPTQTAEMEANRDMRIWLAPIAGTRVLIPARIQIRTPVGMAVIEPTRLELGAPAATATVRR